MPVPPYFSAISIPINPILPILRMVSSGNLPLSSNSVAMGAISFCAKSRAAWRIIWCSSVSERLMPCSVDAAAAIRSPPLIRSYVQRL